MAPPAHKSFAEAKRQSQLSFALLTSSKKFESSLDTSRASGSAWEVASKKLNASADQLTAVDFGSIPSHASFSNMIVPKECKSGSLSSAKIVGFEHIQLDRLCLCIGFLTALDLAFRKIQECFLLIHRGDQVPESQMNCMPAKTCDVSKRKMRKGWYSTHSTNYVCYILFCWTDQLN